MSEPASDFVLDHESFNGKLYIREWQPGDGLRCSAGKKAGRVLCGPPVAVVLLVKSYHWRTKEDRFHRISCALHLPGVTSAGDISAAADRAARERLLVEHWDDYQQYLSEAIAQRVADTIQFASEKLRKLALDGQVEK